MKFATAAFFSAILCADAALGAAMRTPRRRASTSREDRQLASRNGAVRSSHPKIAVESDANNSNAEYSQNWAGAVLIGTGYTSVTGTVTVPSVSGASDSAGSAWVGIDGDTCSTAILQTGIDWYGDGTYDAWYEWYPDYAYNFNLAINEGDEIKMTVTASSKTSGKAVVENLTTGKTATENFSNVSDGDLCEYNAEWIVEDFSQCTGNSCTLVPFADFGTVKFTDASATKSGSTVSVSGATIIDIKQNNDVLTSCSASGSTVTCTYE